MTKNSAIHHAAAELEVDNNRQRRRIDELEAETREMGDTLDAQQARV